MRVLFWVQHLLGTGHLKRATILAGAMAARGLEVVIVSGGPRVAWPLPRGVDLVQLPPVRAADERFSLLDEAGHPAGEPLWAARRARLLDLLEQLRPRVLMTEMFPFGRRAFRAELLGLLDAAARARPKVWRIASVRDVLVQKAAPERSAWMRDVALSHYDLVLAHTDPAVVPFGLTFPYADALGRHLVSTGYVAPPAPAQTNGRQGEGEVLVSAGGGRVGHALLAAALRARPLSRICDCAVWRLVTGPGLPDDDFARLVQDVPEGVLVEREREDFQTLLANSLLSVSQAGYNTVVEALGYNKTMVLVPFETGTETEQRVRAERLAALGLAVTVATGELSPQRLAHAVDTALAGPRLSKPAVDLMGASRSALLIARLAGRTGGRS